MSTLQMRVAQVSLFTFGLACCLFFFAEERPTRADEKKPMLLKVIDLKKIDLNEKQVRILERIKRSPATGNSEETLHLAVLDPQALKGDAPPSIQMTNLLSIELKGMKLIPQEKDTGSKGARLDWERETDRVMLSMKDQSSTGLIYSNNNVYAVEPLGEGLHAITRIDQRKYIDCDHDKDVKEKEVRVIKVPKPQKGTVVTILVAYTPKVNDLQADVEALINAAVDQANVSYANSGIDLRLELVESVQVKYKESKTPETDLEKFLGTDDGEMDQIHQIRNQKKADICVLLIDNGKYCGLAAEILAEAKTAFAVVHHDCAVKNLSFAHEVGHLFGARHDLAFDPTPGSNHGYLSKEGNWRTIMAYPTMKNPNRIPYWSNPNVKHLGEAMGTKKLENNAEQVAEGGIIASSFK